MLIVKQFLEKSYCLFAQKGVRERGGMLKKFSRLYKFFSLSHLKMCAAHSPRLSAGVSGANVSLDTK